MNTHVAKEENSRGINPTIYDPSEKEKQKLDTHGVKRMQGRLKSMNTLIGFSHMIPNELELLEPVNTKWGSQTLGSPLSFVSTTDC